jgi:Contractile injection system tube protein
MPQLAKAKLCPMQKDKDVPIDPTAEFSVQFNPSSMHLVLQSVSDMPKTPARQTEQHLGSGNLTVSLDLHFDTADEGQTGAPQDVRERTQQVAQFMLPKAHSSEPPPRVRFSWGHFVVIGVMASYNEDIDLFSPEGTPLRAKVSISIRGQDASFAANETGPGARTGAGATAPGRVGGAPGTVGFGVSLSVGASVGLSAGLSLGASSSDRTGIAIGGESAAEFAARMGADPAAWRGMAAGLASTVSIPAGTEIDFSSNLSAGVGVGTAVGLGAGSSASPQAAVGLAGESSTPARPGAAPGTASGLALAAAGGVQSAIQTVQIASAGAAATDAKQAYALAPPLPAAPAPLRPPAAEQPRPPLRSEGLPVPAARPATEAAPLPPQADTRATTFGFGVPLRPLVAVAAGERSGALGGVVPIGPRAALPAAQAPATADPTVAPWRMLPPADPGRAAADAAQQRVRPTTPCSCGGGCGCSGGCR